MMRWDFVEALSVDTCGAVTRWWVQRRPSPEVAVPDGLVRDIQEARLAFEEDIEHRVWNLVVLLPERERRVCGKMIARLDPSRVWWWLRIKRLGPALAKRTVAEKNV